MNGKQVIKKLQEDGWKVVRIKGSHVQLKKGSLHTTIPIHGHSDLAKGILSAIQRQTGVKLS